MGDNVAAHDRELDQAVSGLHWLAEHGALAGVYEVIRERRRQVELGWTPELDDSRRHGELMLWAANRLHVMRGKVQDGTARHYEHLEACRQAGALAAAELDRLNRVLSP
jgi:hypothetical protein